MEDGDTWRGNGTGPEEGTGSPCSAVMLCSPRVALGCGHLPGAAPAQELVLLLTHMLVAPCWKVAAVPLSLC